MNDWISTKDRLPEEKRVVPVYHTEYGLCIGSCGWGKSKVWHIQPFKEESWKVPMRERVTHWLPIPDLPKVEPPAVFYIKERHGLLLPPTYAQPWGIYHVANGWIGDVPDEHTAQHFRDRLNRLWPCELNDQVTEQLKPDVIKVFRVEKSRVFHSRYWVEHCTWGDVTVYGTRRKAQSICDRLNQLWQLEENSR